MQWIKKFTLEEVKSLEEIQLVNSKVYFSNHKISTLSTVALASELSIPIRER